ncbi:Nuclear receptor domain-containing protein [Caenorhabditis elegans]|uniref:Nuclear receptor domain-containing protein n=1 Tax=Caenorhabditis elegans TaxID=6239 RepID=O45664_CAEEL|nr:Nuclear receptor domain-containing protein [Caenorhabditis elegans]CAB05759.2 Nuclear receptor domain-containing protein [Caenorhabditis elegans]|eukprot:NP_506903.2 Nuclear Hormone Receptor family [Caenorhabditis elegans]
MTNYASIANFKTEESVLVREKCVICFGSALGMNYGALTCSACKMFFRRSAEKKLSYNCKKDNQCSIAQRKCRACRFQKCLNFGMTFYSFRGQLAQNFNNLDQKLELLLKELTIKDGKNYTKFINYYSNEDPSLVDVLKNSNVMKMKKRTPHTVTDSHDWAFLGIHARISYFMDFEFINKLSLNDKVILFKYNALRMGCMTEAMRCFTAKRAYLVTPSGEDVYLPIFRRIFEKTPALLDQTSCMVLYKFIELNITNEECILLALIFFCNPAISDELSEKAKETLSRHQKRYCSALLQYCQSTCQKSAPSRLTDLLSLYNVTNKAYDGFQYLCMTFQCLAPDFRGKQLVYDTCLDIEKNNSKENSSQKVQKQNQKINGIF